MNIWWLIPFVDRYGCLALSRLAAGNVLFKYGAPLRPACFCRIVLNTCGRSTSNGFDYYNHVLSCVFLFFCLAIVRQVSHWAGEFDVYHCPEASRKRWPDRLCPDCDGRRAGYVHVRRYWRFAIHGRYYENVESKKLNHPIYLAFATCLACDKTWVFIFNLQTVCCARHGPSQDVAWRIMSIGVGITLFQCFALMVYPTCLGRCVNTHTREVFCNN